MARQAWVCPFSTDHLQTHFPERYELLVKLAIAKEVEVGHRGRHCSPHYRMPFDSTNEGREREASVCLRRH